MTRDIAIVAAIVALLKASGAVAQANVYEARSVTLTGDTLAAIDVHPVEADSQTMGGNYALQSSLQVRLVVQARETSTLTAYRAADAIIEVAHKALMADRTLGGLAANVLPRMRRWDDDQADGAFARVQLFYDVIFTTQAADLAAAI